MLSCPVGPSRHRTSDGTAAKASTRYPPSIWNDDESKNKAARALTALTTLSGFERRFLLLSRVFSSARCQVQAWRHRPERSEWAVAPGRRVAQPKVRHSLLHGSHR